MALGSHQDRTDELLGIATVPSMHTGGGIEPTMPSASTTNLPEIIETNELLKAKVEAADAHNRELEATLNDLRKKMKAIHVSSPAAKLAAK